MALKQIIRDWLGLTPWAQFWPVDAQGNAIATPVMPNWKAARALAAVERAVMLYAQGLLLPRSIVDAPADGGTTTVTGTDASHALASASEDDLLIAGYSAALLGAGYLRIARNDRGGASALTYVATNRVTLERTTNGTRKLYARIAADDALGEPEALIPESEFICFRWRPSPDNPLVGESPLNAIAPAIACALQLRDTQGKLLGNASIPLVVLSTENQLTDVIIKRLRTNWFDNFSGSAQGRTAIVDSGLKVDTIDLSKAVDLQLMEAFNAYVREIGRAWGVPVTLLNESAEMSYNSAIEASRSFVLHSLRPWLARIAGELGRKLLTDAERAAGRCVRFDDSPLMLAPGTETSEYLSRLVSAGIMTPDEARDRIGLGDIEGGALLRVPVNLTPATAADDAAANRIQ